MRATTLGDLEAAVLEHLWDAGSGDVKSVHAALRARRITPNTIQSTLRRLFDKGLLERVKVSHAYVYSPRLDRRDFHRRVLEEAVGEVLSGEADVALAAFVDLVADTDEEHLRRLEELIAAKRRGPGGGGE
ncbi:MAG: BlaI/MecI/CopY family transcriptional regulator [Myxococcales bacterium]|nr:BlaI/MecI/CopY family transcriptional regulator [Myxococcales bacterium]